MVRNFDHIINPHSHVKNDNINRDYLKCLFTVQSTIPHIRINDHGTADHTFAMDHIIVVIGHYDKINIDIFSICLIRTDN